MRKPDIESSRLFECIPGCFVILSTDFTIVAATPDYLAAAKLSREELVGKNFFSIFPDHPGDVRAVFARVLRELVTVVTPAHKVGANLGKAYWRSVNVPVIENGTVTHIIRRVDDITSEVDREGEKNALEQERDLIFAHSFDLIGIVGADGYFKRLNPAFERAMGYTEQELCSEPLISFLHPDDVTKTKKGIQILSGGTPTIASKNRYRCKDGSYKWFSWNTTPMGPLFYTVGRDITEQVNSEVIIRQLNGELARKNEELEQKIEARMVELRRSEEQIQQLQKMDALGRLAGGIAHDFNNMLGAISLSSEMIAEDPGASDFVQKNARQILDVTERAAALTRQLLVFSRKQVKQQQTVLLNPLIMQLEKMLTRLIGENIQIVTKLAANLRYVNVDPSQMEQVILNLVVNARDAMPHGGTITVETENTSVDETFTSSHLSVSPGEYVVLTVTDVGTGMDTATVGRIFEPFFTTKPIGKGTGLGLTTAYAVVKQSNGTIWVYSEPGKGAVFKVYLPACDQAPEELVAPLSEPTDARGDQTILLVEDDDSLRDGFFLTLAKSGYSVLVASNASEALGLLANQKGHIDLLLTDMVMPGMSGFELAQHAVELRRDLKVIYMSGYTNDALENSGIDDLGQLDFLQKPFGAKALLSTVQRVLNK